ncbi:hypothetical protein BGW41_004804 [Actinomortierella wolfii]|nr:hypothetical protein BGW41_004804 [Actinomortierella wolfii]
MKATTILSVSAISALYMASLVAGQNVQKYDDPGHIDTCNMPGVVAYTFDDGPAEYNDELLAVLARKNVKATFFMLGQMIAQYPGQIKKIMDAGHQLASHTYTHSNLDKLTPEAIHKELVDTNELMFKEAGVRPTYMRAPEGRCAEPCKKVVAELGMVLTHWNADTNDWRHKGLQSKEAVPLSMKQINDYIINDSDPTKDSFIVLQHELLPWSVRDLTGTVIDAITAKGYKFVTIEECLGKPAYQGGAPPQPPTPNPTTPAPAPGTGSPAPGTGNLAPNAGNPAPSAGAPAPTDGKPSPSASSTPIPPAAVSKPDSGASIKQLGAWAMGAAALASYLLL